MEVKIEKHKKSMVGKKISLTKGINACLDKDESLIDAFYVEEVLSEATRKFTELQNDQNSLLHMLGERKEIADSQMTCDLDSQIEKDVEYNDKTIRGIASLKSLIQKLRPPIVSSPSNSDLGRSTNSSVHLKLPELKINHFSNNEKDSFEFFRFLGSFNNAMDSIPGVKNSVKLVYLKSYLSGRALALIENLPINDSSFDSAMTLLSHEFLDKQLLINDTLSSIVDHKVCTSLQLNTNFISFVKAKLSELNNFNIDFFIQDSPGEILMSNIVRSKLFKPFFKELCRRMGTNYPSVSNIINEATSISKLIGYNDNSNKNGGYSSSVASSSNANSSNQKEKHYTSNKSGTDPTPQQSVCRFCFKVNHSSINCKEFSNHLARVKRVKYPELCERCLSSKHREDKCPGNQGKLPFSCKSCRCNSHVSPMCPDMVLSLCAAKVVKSDGDKK